MSNMRTLFVALALAHIFGISPCLAQDYDDYMYDDYRTKSSAGEVYSESGEDSRYDASVRPEDNIYVRDDGRYVHKRTRYVESDRLSREEYETRVIREKARQRHLDNSVGRDDSYTEVYESNNRAQERQNIINTVEGASQAARDVANTIKVIENLF